MDRLDAMLVLVTVVDSGSLSAASRALNTPLPSVSRKVAELERCLGTRLITRTSRNVQLTDAGRDYVEAAREILDRLADAESRASGEYSQPRGELTMTIPVEFGRLMVAPIISDFLEENPGVSLKIIYTNRVVHLAEEHVDVCIRVADLPDSSLSAIKLGEATFITCASPRYLELHGRPSHPNELANFDAIIFTDTEVIPWIYERDGQQFEAKPRARMRVNSGSSVSANARSGAGIVRAPSYWVVDDLRSGALVRVLEEYSCPIIPVHLIYLKQGLMPLKVRAFLDWATPILRKRLKHCAQMASN